MEQFFLDLYQSMISAVGVLTPCFVQQNVAAAQNNVALFLLGSADNGEFCLPVSGNVVGISVTSNEACTAGTLTVTPRINGVNSTSLSAVINTTNTLYASAIQEPVKDGFDANQPIAVRITTSAGWLPVTADIVVNLICLL